MIGAFGALCGVTGFLLALVLVAVVNARTHAKRRQYRPPPPPPIVHERVQVQPRKPKAPRARRRDA